MERLTPARSVPAGARPRGAAVVLLAAALLPAAAVGRPSPAAAAGARAPAVLLARFAPVLRQDARDRWPATSVDAVLRGAPPRPAASVTAVPAVVYARAARGADRRTWLQYWRFSAYNPQDRGVLRTGRHEGDWEFTQIGLSPAGVPERMTLAQHAWAESCPWARVERDAGAPVVYVANGSHASYRTRGEHGRPWPDPDDEARGDAPAVRPRVVVITGRSPAWVTRRARWGRTRASWVPAESDAPRGPMFQPDGRWQDPAGYDAGARACGSGAPGRPLAVALGLAAPPLLLVAAVVAAVARARRGPERRTAAPEGGRGRSGAGAGPTRRPCRCRRRPRWPPWRRR